MNIQAEKLEILRLILETDNPNGLIDLIGHTLVGNETDHINFMSYNEVITETVSFEQKALVSPGNTLAFNTTIEYNNEVQHNLYLYHFQR